MIEKMVCISCPYNSPKYGCQAVKRVCEIPAIKNELHKVTLDGKSLVLNAVDISNMTDFMPELAREYGDNAFSLRPLINSFGE